MLRHQAGNKRGISIIEILVVIAICAIALASLLSLATFSLENSTLIKDTSLARNIAQETIEAVRNFRDGTNWENDDPENKYDGLGIVSAGISYYPEKSSDSPSKWMLIQGEKNVNGFTRKVIFENVMRDGNDNIVVSGGANDPNTKKATVTVSWLERGRAHQVEIITYLTNWKQ